MINADMFLGMTKKGSQDKAEAMNLIFRLIRVDDRAIQSYPSDQRTDRLCVELEGGKVVKAVIL